MTEPRPRQRKFAPRSRQGCLTCRARRKRCDGQHPECQNCTRLNVKCEWQKQRQIIKESSPVRARALSTPISPSSSSSDGALCPIPKSLDPWESFSGDKASERRHLLSYYIDAFVPSVSVATTPSSFYTSLYIPMAFESAGMLDAIIAISSSQLAKRTLDIDRAHHLQDLSSKHQVKCHTFLRERIAPTGEPLQDIYQVIAVTLLLVTLEALNGTKSTKWMHQLRSVRKILNSAFNEQGTLSSWELECLARHFTYHDVMATLMATLAEGEPHALSERDVKFFSPCAIPTIDPLMGISYHLCSLIRQIQYVTSPNPAFPNLSEAAFYAIERDIKEWKYESPLSAPGIDLPVALDLVALAEAYRLAAFIHLYRHSDTHRSLVPSCAVQALQFISRIPVGSPAESSLLYPIFLIGAELTSERDIATCFQRLAAIKERNRFENIANVEKVLQEVWKPAFDGGSKRDWEDVLKEWGWSISLS